MLRNFFRYFVILLKVNISYLVFVELNVVLKKKRWRVEEKNEKWKKIIVERTSASHGGEFIVHRPTPMAGTSGRPKGQSPRLRGR
jgi:hypothetical protein